ncbi:hypothetical protein N7532_002120 [Penicillium argentinense]|uniref:Membrane anchor Opy2 N-terminal domain-containing protein n=1 Tax=Penicillium argentinense TaxID=1131581 RepID=A0A9W9KMF2_9EURO|nr:uncharacterized protein N7532_002120 [Penicillium argentinense]KAJ5111585.1 hypothetical protein N7532_002120 [Penicillium argentinense]
MTTQTCDSCSETKCIDDGSSSSGPPPSSGPNVGAIAGGVIGGVAAIVLLLFLIWWFVIRKRRNQEGDEKNNEFAAQRAERKSTGGNSIASTVLTRASNVIQIAYIPGVTNRSPPETPASLVPPVPPLPGAAPDQHFFMPGDLRDSSWTTTTGHQSMSPTLRSSVATTIYRNDAIVSAIPAQQISRSRANIVSVHNTSPDADNAPAQPVPVMITPKDAPAVPAITQSQLAKAEAMKGNSSIVARQVVAKPVMVRGASVKKKDGKNSTDASSKDEQSQKPNTAGSGTSSQQFDHQTSTFDGNSSDEEEEDDTRPSSASHSNGANVTSPREDSSKGAGPFHDHASTEAHSSSLNDRTTTPPPRVQSPFSDANEVK